ncbi:hypothetical protein [Labilithrix luteola]|uniref:hypothetical protein n=1 Tax=Labilithrix luteola TaxID=1391654 RepID=UPI0011BAD3BB|nr:hypothetical protein [Labilithrix luteola]
MSSVVLFGALGTTQAEPLRVDWQVHGGCPGADSFWSALAERSERARRAEDDEAAKQVSIEIVKLKKGSVGRVSIDGTESRTIAGATCLEVIDALAIVTALSLEPGEPPPMPAPRATSLPPPPLVEEPAERSFVAASGPKSWRWGVGVGVGAFFTENIGGVVTTPLSLEYTNGVTLRLGFSRGTSDVVRSAGGPGGRFTWTTGRLDVCVPRGRSKIDLLPCLGLESGALQGEPVDVVHPQDSVRFWLAAHASARVAVNLIGPVDLELEGGVAFALSRPEFVVDPNFPIYEPSPLVFHMRSGPVVHFQ